MDAAPTRYRQRPPEIDAMIVDSSSINTAVGWLRSHGRDGYITGAGLRVAARVDREGTEVEPGFDVPPGHHLIRDVRTGGWAPVPPATLAAEYVSVRELERAAERAVRGAHRR